MRKAYSKTGRVCRVTFELSPDSGVYTVALCGEFNDWNPTAHLMKRRKNGSFSLTLSLLCNQQYRFRYLLDGVHWSNDPTADAYAGNPFGSEDSILQL